MSTAEPRDIVLVVDDSPESLTLITDALEESGYTALVARSGAAALTVLEHTTPDVILMDAVMPEMDGFEACRRIKQNRHFAHTPIIFMTGLAEAEHVLSGFQAGGVDYVTKPVVPSVLVARIQTHMKNARLSQSARVALDVAGSTLMAVDRVGKALWTTPRAAAELRAAYGGQDGDMSSIHDMIRGELAGIVGRGGNGTLGPHPDAKLRVTYLGEARPGEFLLGLTDNSAPRDEDSLRETLGLTEREAEVLLWIAQGKSNRDIADILKCSPRTVNKHLEQIFRKLGVENRTSAAMAAVRILSSRGRPAL